MGSDCEEREGKRTQRGEEDKERKDRGGLHLLGGQKDGNSTPEAEENEGNKNHHKATEDTINDGFQIIAALWLKHGGNFYGLRNLPLQQPLRIPKEDHNIECLQKRYVSPAKSTSTIGVSDNEEETQHTHKGDAGEQYTQCIDRYT